jgi:hypothetical protein
MIEEDDSWEDGQDDSTDGEGGEDEGWGEEEVTSFGIFHHP